MASSGGKIDDIWASMNEDYTRNLPIKTKPSKNDIKMEIKVKKSSKKVKEEKEEVSILGNVKASNDVEIKKKKKKVIKPQEVDSDDDVANELHVHELKHEVKTISYADFMTLFGREVSALGDNDATLRKRSLLALHQALTIDYKFPTAKEYNQCFHELAKVLLKRCQDSIEKCREIAFKVMIFFFENAQDFVPILGYYIPTLLQQNPKNIGYDEEMKVFVHDIQAHEAYKRGKAIDRQDKAFHSESSLHMPFVELSEEIRYYMIKSLTTLIQRVQVLDCMPILHPYFEDIIYLLQIALHDNNPDSKVLTCDTLAFLANLSDYELGFKYYAVALIRSVMIQLRHRHAKVRIAALQAVHAIMIVPDRMKRKACGSEAIMDLVGFREDNVLPIAAFYKAEVQFNYMAALVSDTNCVVRERLALLLTTLLTEIDDRYDHQQRLLPYILDLLMDEIEGIATIALKCLQRCGQQYEEEHHDELMTKRQYNVDGDIRINLTKPLPAPFTKLGRPSIGMRMFTRGNCKRFLTALINELMNWKSEIRLKSAYLLKMIFILCEEHLTMEIHSLLPSLIKALKYARDDNDTVLVQVLLEGYELLGRYVLPEIYLYYVLPRLRGDVDVVAFEQDNESRLTVLLFLQALLSGSKSAQIIPFLDEIVDIVTNEMLLNFVDSLKLAHAVVDILQVLCSSTISSDTKSQQSIIEAYYLSTGRLSSLQITIRKIFRVLLTIASLYTTELQEKCLQVMTILASVEGSSNGGDSGLGRTDLHRLFATHIPYIVHDILSNDYEIDTYRTTAMGATRPYESTYTLHQVLQRLLVNPYYIIQRDAKLMNELFMFCRRMLTVDIKELDGHVDYEEHVFYAIGQLLTFALQPLCLAQFSASSKAACDYFYALTTSNSSSESNASKDKRKDKVIFGLEAIVSKEELQALQQVMTTHFSLLLEVFVYNHHWSKSSSLNHLRLQILALCSNQWNTHIATNLAVVDVEEEDEDSIKCSQHFPLCQLAILRQELSRLADTVLSSALLPTTPQATRLLAVKLFHGLLTQWKHVNPKMEKVKSFAWWKAQQPEVSAEDLIHIKLAAQPIVTALLVAMNDSDDDVRIAIIHTLLDSVSMILSDEELLYIKENMHLYINKGYLVVLDILREQVFSVVVKKLLYQVFLESAMPSSVGDCRDEVVTYLDATLRSLAVLDPQGFEGIVRQEYSAMQATADGSESNEERQQQADLVSAMLNHVDILLSLSS